MKLDLKITQKLLDNRNQLLALQGKSTSIPNHEGLEVRIGARGYAYFVLNARLPPKKLPSRKTFGTTNPKGKYPFMSLKEAKTKAASLMGEVRHGLNPFQKTVTPEALGPLLSDIVAEWITKELKDLPHADRSKVTTWPNWPRNKLYCYRSFIEHLEGHLDKREPRLSDLTHQNAKNFLFTARSKRTFKVHRSALSALHRFIVEDYFAEHPKLATTYTMAEENRIASIERTFPRSPETPFHRLTYDETNYFLSELERRTHTDPSNWRHYYALTLCIYNGLRISEAVSLKVKDDGSGNYIDLTNNLIEFRSQKNDRVGSAPLLQTTRSVIEKVMELNKKSASKSVFLFPQENKFGFVSVRKCGDLFGQVRDNLANEIGWTEERRKGITQKKLRNTFATLQAEKEEGYSLEETCTILRHSSVEVTKAYYIDPRAAVMAINRHGGVKPIDITRLD